MQSSPTEDVGPVDFTQTVETMIPGTACNDDDPSTPLEHDDRPASSRIGKDSMRFIVRADSVLPKSEGWHSGDPSGNGSSEFEALESIPPDPMLESFVLNPPEDAEPADSTEIPSLEAMHSKDFRSALNLDSTEIPSAASASLNDWESRPRSWPMLLLASYASAVTIALAFVLWTGTRKPRPVFETLPRASRLEETPSARPRLSLIAPRNLTPLGQPVTIGFLELTPLSIAKEIVALTNTNFRNERHGSMSGTALVLRLRVRNTSADHTFAPFDQAFLRDSDTRRAETFIETEAQPIGAFPLALTSEMAIAGQTFEPLKPGETVETVVVSDREPNIALSPRMTWRIKLRVSASEVATVGVVFTPEEIR